MMITTRACAHSSPIASHSDDLAVLCIEEASRFTYDCTTFKWNYLKSGRIDAICFELIRFQYSMLWPV